MTSAKFRIIHAGPLVTFQDSGRPGHMRFGVCASGPMHQASYIAANLAAGHCTPSTAIEISMGGLVLECISGGVCVAIVGGEFQIECAGRKLNSGAVFTVEAGETLSIKPGKLGSWCYLSFSGTVCAPQWLGKTATHAASGFGGGILQTGQEIHVSDCKLVTARERTIKPIEPRSNRYFRIVLGPQDQYSTEQAKDNLLNAEFSLTDAYDRMGVRLSGPELPLSNALSIPSEPIMRGSVQVSGDGIATVLLADHQTTGGYPKIATLISSDLDDFVQMRPRDRFRFMAVTPQSAVKIARVHAQNLKSYFDAIESQNTRS